MVDVVLYWSVKSKDGDWQPIHLKTSLPFVPFEGLVLLFGNKGRGMPVHQITYNLTSNEAFIECHYPIECETTEEFNAKVAELKSSGWYCGE